MEKPIKLVRRDLLDLEQRLCDSLHKVLHFESHALYFPLQIKQKTPEWLPEEEKLLLPLWRDGELLGVFMARKPVLVPEILPALEDIASLCLDNLELDKISRTDPRTGLATDEYLRQRLIQEADLIREAFRQDTETERTSSMGLIAVRFSGMRQIERELGYAFAKNLLQKLADVFAATLPDQALGARPGDYTFAALLPEAAHSQCFHLGEALTQAMNQVRLVDPLTGRRVGVQISAGFALYPQDMDGIRLRDMSEHAHILLHKACLAADIAHDRAKKLSLLPQVLDYGRILLEGCEIRETLPLSRVLLSLGYQAGVREGQRFSVWSERKDDPSPVCKGEVVVLEVRESESIAEILTTEDPTWSLEAGDVLKLIPAKLSNTDIVNKEDKISASNETDPLTGLLRHSDFLAQFAEIRNDCQQFGLALVHLTMHSAQNGKENVPQNADAHSEKSQTEQTMAKLADFCRKTFADQTQEGFSKKLLAGRFGLNSLIFFHPQVQSKDLQTVYTTLCTQATELFGHQVSAGLAVWPFLQFHPADILECVRKALDYALLLPPPHVGLFDSLALNISADKHSCRQDIFTAIEEYKLALLADEKNTLAWNSLGVCMASLGRLTEAQRDFEEAVRCAPQDPSPAYNLGAICQGLGEKKEATAQFQRCLELDPNHLYARVRLGQLAESIGKFDEAEKWFTSAADLHRESALPYRHLARLALRRERPDLAREQVHQALLRNPRDTASLTLMAKLYLDGGEDPQLAESLARQSVALNPDQKNAWLILAHALEIQGHQEDAQKARLHAV